MKSKGLILFFGYWLFFVILPASLPLVMLGWSLNSLALSFLLLFLLIIFAERGLRLWGTLFKNK
jgi:hypothetical protein